MIIFTISIFEVDIANLLTLHFHILMTFVNFTNNFFIEPITFDQNLQFYYLLTMGSFLYDVCNTIRHTFLVSFVSL